MLYQLVSFFARASARSFLHYIFGIIEGYWQELQLIYNFELWF
jgi:hypothetical protein